VALLHKHNHNGIDLRVHEISFHNFRNLLIDSGAEHSPTTSLRVGLNYRWANRWSGRTDESQIRPGAADGRPL
jgi:hypothetical protein